MKIDFSALTTEAPPVRRFALLTLALVLLGVLLRLLLPLQSLGDPDMHSGEGFVPLLTYDSGLYGFLAGELIDGARPAAARHPVHLPSRLLAVIVQLLPVTLDQAVYWLPVLLAPLFLIPLVLIGRELQLGWTIFPTAAVALIIPAYYLRSHAGYLDTDMLNTFFPLVLALSMIRLVRRRRLTEALPGALAIMLYQGWYHASAPLIMAQLGLFLCYALLSDRKETAFYQALLCWGIAFMPVPWPLRLAALAVLTAVLPRIRLPYRIWWLIFAGGALAILLATDAGRLLLLRLQVYVFRPDALTLSHEGTAYSFVQGMDLVSESRPTDIIKFTGTAAGHLLLFLPGLLGLILLIRRHRETLLVLPIFALGLLALSSGSRFTFYAAHILPLGLAAFLTALHPTIKKNFKLSLPWFAALLVGIQGGNALFRAIRINKVNAVPVFSSRQVPALRALGKTVRPADYAVAWWDYGWGLWYYTGLATIVDNGKNNFDSHAIARLLTEPDQRRAARTARLLATLHAGAPGQPALLSAMQHYTNLAGFQRVVDGETPLPPAPGRAFLILPRQMQTIINGIMAHAIVDPAGGRRAHSPFWFFGRITERNNGRLSIDNLASLRRIDGNADTRLTIDLHAGTVSGQKLSLPIKRVVLRKPDGTAGIRRLHPAGINLVQDGEDIALCEDSLFDSLYCRLFLLGEYDPELFRQVHFDRELAVYEVLAE